MRLDDDSWTRKTLPTEIINPMKRLFPLLQPLGLIFLLTWMAGCATNSRRTEGYLAASGFKVMPATTPEQLQQLKTLPDKKITVVKRNGQVYFVYPDKAQNQLYIGQNPQYSKYQSLLLSQQALQEGLQADQNAANAEVLNAEATAFSADPWAVYGVWPLLPY